MKISILYCSETGNTETAANWVASGARSVPNTEVRMFNLAVSSSPDKAFIQESDAIIFGTPVYVANMCWQLKKWFDTRLDYRLGGKLGGAFATENSPCGGGEAAILTIINHMMVKGMLAYASGVEWGRPYIHLGPTLVRGKLEERKDMCFLFGQRMAMKAHELFDK